MLFNDGDYEIYQIQFTGSGVWHSLSFDVAWVPMEIYAKYNQQWNAFSASGGCWQQTGEYGTFDADNAMAVFTSLKLHGIRKEYKYRVVKRIVSQKTEVFAS